MDGAATRMIQDITFYVIALSFNDALEKVQINELTFVKAFAEMNLRKSNNAALKIFKITVKEQD